MSYDQMLDGAKPPHKNNPMNNLDPKDHVNMLKIQMNTRKEAEIKEILEDRYQFNKNSNAYSKAFDDRMETEAQIRKHNMERCINERKTNIRMKEIATEFEN